MSSLTECLLSYNISAELQLSFGHGAGCPGGRAVPAEGQQGAEQEHVQLPLSGRYSQGRSAGWTHRGHNNQRAGR